MIVSHFLVNLHKKIQFYIFMFEAWNVAKGRKGAEYFRKALYMQILQRNVALSLHSLGFCEFHWVSQVFYQS